MKPIFYKELRDQLAGYSGTAILGVFILLLGIYLWIYNGDANLLNYGFADMAPFFEVLPPLLALLISALCMGSFAQEQSRGTMEILMTTPVGFTRLFMGKLVAVLLIIFLVLLLTSTTAVSLHVLARDGQALDAGSALCGYLGAFLMALTFITTGLFCSSLVQNQVLAFVLSLVLNLAFFYGPQGLISVTMAQTEWLALGGQYHYDVFTRGILSSFGVTYFVSVALFFFALSEIIHRYRKNRLR